MGEVSKKWWVSRTPHGEAIVHGGAGRIVARCPDPSDADAIVGLFNDRYGKNRCNGRECCDQCAMGPCCAGMQSTIEAGVKGQ